VSRSLHCSAAVHAAIAADPVAFARCSFVGYQPVEADGALPPDLIELRNCACGGTIGVRVGAPMVARLAQARREDDIAMIARCRSALEGDPGAVQSLRDSLLLEAMMRGAEAA
jgi:hypothetical protein